MLVVSSQASCFDTATAVVRVYDPLSILIPNVMAPNGDGQNDVFRAEINNPVDHFEGAIFNRWGTKISVFDINGWDGKSDGGENVAAGVYFYTITFDFVGQYYKYNGSITVFN